MRRLAALFAIIVSSSAGAQVNPQGSFFRTRVRTTDALVRQYDRDPKAQQRFVKVFGKNKAETRKILSSLKPKQLTEEHRYPVASYTKKGGWHYFIKTMPKGQLVFVKPDGTPLLKGDCGNPVVMYPAGRPSGSVALVPAAGKPMVHPGPAPPPTTPAPPEVTTIAVPWAELPIIPMVEFVPTELTVSPVPPETLFEVPQIPVHKGNNWWLALLPFLFLLNFGGGGGPPGGPIIPPPPPPPPPGVIPESPSAALFLAGLSGLVTTASLRRRSGRRRMS